MYIPGITSAEYAIIIHFPTKGQVALSPATEVTGPNILNSVSLGLSLAGSNQNPVGVISANTLTLDIDSRDLSLDPTNTQSPYYGEMNSSAWVTYYLTENGEQINMGTYFVNTWNPNISNSSPYNISIQLTDLMSVIAKMAVPKVDIKYNMTLKEYIIAVINKLNEQNPFQYNIFYNPDTIKFGNITNFYYEQLNTSTVGDMLNTISQCTLTNITINQQGYFITDNLLDEVPAQAVMEIDGDNYTFSANLAPSSWISYDGIKVNYTPRKIVSKQQLASISSQELQPGDNTISGLSLGGHAYSIEQIVISTEDPTDASFYIKSLSYDKDVVDLVIDYQGLSTVSASISIIGSSAATETKIFSQDAGGSILNCNVPILYESDLGYYASSMRAFLKNKQKAIKVVGWYNPRLTLGDLVHVTLGGDLNLEGYYKVTGMDLTYSNAGMNYTLQLDPAIIGGA